MKNELKLWDYLAKKLKPLNDNNKTTREIWRYVVKYSKK